MFSLIFTYYRKGIIRYFRRDTLAKSVTAFLFLFIILILALLTHFGFYFGFSYILKDNFFGEAISLYIIELFLLISSVLVFASAMVSGMVILFRADDGPILLASPRYALKPFLVFSRMFFSSLWPLLVIIIPALIAIVRVFPLSNVGFLLTLFSGVLLVFIAVLLAMLMLFTVSFILFSLRIFSKRHLLIVNTTIFFSFLGIIWLRFHAVNLADFFQARLLSRNVPDLTPILHQFDIFPSHVVTMVLYYSEHGEFIFSFASFIFLTLFACVLFLLFVFSTRHYLEYWQVAQENVGMISGPIKNMHGTPFIARATSAQVALLLKECILFVRNPKGMLWLGFILVIWGIQSASSFFLVHGLGVERVTEGKVPLIAGAFQFALVAYFMSMFALRFTFPSFSEEQKTAWVVRSSPLAISDIFTAKLYFFIILFCTIAVLFTALNVSIIGFSLVTTPLLFAMVIVSVITITVYALSLGALFPNNETDDPEVLSTTLPGLSFIALSLIYGGLGALVFREYALFGGWGFVTLFVGCSFLGTMYLIYVARMSLTNRYIA